MKINWVSSLPRRLRWIMGVSESGPQTWVFSFDLQCVTVLIKIPRSDCRYGLSFISTLYRSRLRPSHRPCVRNERPVTCISKHEATYVQEGKTPFLSERVTYAYICVWRIKEKLLSEYEELTSQVWSSQWRWSIQTHNPVPKYVGLCSFTRSLWTVQNKLTSDRKGPPWCPFRRGFCSQVLSDSSVPWSLFEDGFDTVQFYRSYSH